MRKLMGLVAVVSATGFLLGASSYLGRKVMLEMFGPDNVTKIVVEAAKGGRQ